MADLTTRALQFATDCHFGQTRKYTGEAYINHPVEVADIVASVGGSPEMIAAAYLHDVVEDCGVQLSEIDDKFGGEVARLVAWLTDVSTPYHGNRYVRKSLDCAHIALAPVEAMTIKLADLISNTRTIAKLDPGFWTTYRAEKLNLLEVLHRGNSVLWQRAWEQCNPNAEPSND